MEDDRLGRCRSCRRRPPPEATFQTDDGDTVLLIRGEKPEHVQGTWTATARGYNQVFTGVLEVAIAEPAHLTNLVRDFFNLP